MEGLAVIGKYLYPFRINSLTIQNYKGIDELNLEFPKPASEFDPDVVVLTLRQRLECLYRPRLKTMESLLPLGD